MHARDPGYTHKEDFASLTKAAAAGGVTTVMAMPNSNPPLTTSAAISYAKHALGNNNLVEVHLIAGACMDMPERIPDLAAAGAIALDVYDNAFAHGSGRWIQLFEQAAAAGLPLCFYLQDANIEARTRRQLDVTNLSELEKIARTSDGVSECMAIGRIFPMAAYFSVPVVLRMVTTGAAARLIHFMRKEFPQAKVAMEVCVHYLFLNSDALDKYGAAAHIHPPLRSSRDIDALWQAVRDGTVDYIATDHAPHAQAEKDREPLSACATGMIGLETLLPLLLTACAEERLTLQDIERLCCEHPARLYGLYPRKGALLPGSDADMTLVNPSETWRIDADRFYSRGAKSPFDGRNVSGRVVATIAKGKKIMEHGTLL